MLHARVAELGLRAVRRLQQERTKVDAASLPVVDRGRGLDEIDAADHVVETAEAQVCHPAAHVLRQE